jgi:hypothetical protein
MNGQYANLEEEIISAIKSLPNSIPRGTGDKKWTAAIKRALMEIGKRNKYEVCGFPPECEKEWLYDMLWYRNEPPGHLREIGLVLESEWEKNLYAIRTDFEKLLIAKSPIKVFVFQDFKKNLAQLWSLLETGIGTFKTEPANETYILACFQNGEYEFAVRTITA